MVSPEATDSETLGDFAGGSASPLTRGGRQDGWHGETMRQAQDSAADVGLIRLTDVMLGLMVDIRGLQRMVAELARSSASESREPISVGRQWSTATPGGVVARPPAPVSLHVGTPVVPATMASVRQQTRGGTRMGGLLHGRFSSRRRSSPYSHRRSGQGGSSSGGRSSAGTQFMICYGCGQQGHVIRSCPVAREAARATGACYRCGQQGHVARDCSQETARVRGVCYRCGQQGHLVRDCPISSETVLAAVTVSQTQGFSGAESSDSQGRGMRGRDLTQRFAVARGDAQTSDAAIVGMILVCSLKAYALFDLGFVYGMRR
ncbi:hypothetical protein NMG60_11021457 [Bertholletia excelsa]